MEKIDWDKAPEWAEYVVIGICSGVLYWANDCRRQSIGSGGSYDNNIHSFEKWPIHSKRPSPAWNGEGLPPVGAVCEANFVGNWVKFELRYYGEAFVIFKTAFEVQRKRHDFDTCGVKFRPIRTPEQIAADEREAAIEQIMSAYEYKEGTCTHKLMRDQAARFYDAGLYRKP